MSLAEEEVKAVKRPRATLRASTINLSHGGGGKAMHDMIDDVFVGTFDNALLDTMEDQARMSLADLALHGDRLAFTT